MDSGQTRGLFLRNRVWQSENENQNIARSKQRRSMECHYRTSAYQFLADRTATLHDHRFLTVQLQNDDHYTSQTSEVD